MRLLKSAKSTQDRRFQLLEELLASIDAQGECESDSGREELLSGGG